MHVKTANVAIVKFQEFIRFMPLPCHVQLLNCLSVLHGYQIFDHMKVMTVSLDLLSCHYAKFGLMKALSTLATEDLPYVCT